MELSPRRIRVKTPDYDQLIVLEESMARTFAELKDEVNEHLVDNNKAEIDFSQRTVVLMESKLTLQNDNAVLPVEDINVAVYVKETKAGLDQYEDMGFHELRREAKRRGYNNNGVSASELRETLRNDDNRNNVDSSESSSLDSSEKMLEAIDEIEEIVISRLSDLRVIASSITDSSNESNRRAMEVFMSKYDVIKQEMNL